MPLSIKVVLAQAGVPNANGDYFTQEVLERVADRSFAIGPLLVTSQRPGTEPGLADICGKVDMLTVEGDKLVALIDLIDSPAGKVIQKLVDIGLTVLPISILGVSAVLDGVLQDNFRSGYAVIGVERPIRNRRLREVLTQKMKASRGNVYLPINMAHA